MLERISRWREQRGSLPDEVRAELEPEGVVLLEERLPATVIFRGYMVPGQRARSGHQSGRAALAVTERRLVVHGTGNIRLAVPRGAEWLVMELPANDRLKLAYEASNENASRSGDVELELETPRAEAIHGRLTEWMRTPST